MTRLLDGPSGEATPAGVRARSLLALGLTAAKQHDRLTEKPAFTESPRLAHIAGDACTAAMVLTRLTETQLNSVAWGYASAAGEHSRSHRATQFDEALCMFRGLGVEWGAAVSHI